MAVPRVNRCVGRKATDSSASTPPTRCKPCAAVKTNSRGDKLPPRDHLANKKEDAQHGRPAPPVAESIFVVRAEKAARTGQCKAAGNQDDCVEPEDAGELERLPHAVRHALAHDVGAHQRHEEHQDAAKRDDHPRHVCALWNESRAGGAAPLSATAAVAGGSSAAAFSGINLLDNFCDRRACHCIAPKLLQTLSYFARATCAGAKCCGTKSSFAPGTLNSYGPR